MSNVTTGFGDAPSSEARKDEDSDGLHSPHYGEKVSCGNGLSHGDDPSRKKARHEGPGDDSFRNGHTDSSRIKGMHERHGHGLQEAQHDDPSINAAVAEVHGNANAETGRSFNKVDTPSHASVSVAHTHGEPFVESMPSQSAFHKHASLGNEYGSIPADAASGTLTSLAAYGPSSKQFSENMVALDATAAHESPIEHSHTSYNYSKEAPYNGMSEEHMLHGHGGIPESPTAYGLSGWHAGQNCVAGLNSHMSGMRVGKPHEALPANDNIERYTQEKAFPHFGFSDSSATRHTLLGDKGESAQFFCQDTFETYDNREIAINYRFSNNPAATLVHGGSSMYSQSGGEDLKVNLEHMTSSNQAQNLTIKKGSILSGSSYYKSHSGDMKDLAHILRFGGAIFSLIAFSVIISTSEKRVAAGSTFYVKFSDYQAYNYLAALNLLTFLYSSGQLILIAQGRTSRILSSPIKWGASVYLCDQMLAFLMISSSSSAATASELARHGLRNIWPPACSTWKLSLFCSRADVAVGMSFVSCLFMFLSTFSSGYHLSNLLAE